MASKCQILSLKAIMESPRVRVFLMSPEISKVANETCGVLDHIEVVGTPFKAEKIPEDEVKIAVLIEEESGIEEGDTVDGSEELEKQASMDSHDATVESLKEAKETVTEASSTDQVNEAEDTKPEKLPAEAGKEQIILDSLGETLTETVAESEGIDCMDEPEVYEKVEEVFNEEIKCTNGENDGLEDNNSIMKTEELPPQAPDFGTQSFSQSFGMPSELDKDYANSESEKVAVDVIQVTCKDLAVTEASKEMKRDEGSAVAMPEGYITEVELVSIPNKKPSSPMNVVYKDVDTAISGETAEGSASIEDTSVKDHKESSDDNGNTETVEVEISNKNADDSHVTDSSVGQTVENKHENPDEFSCIQPEEQGNEAIGTSAKKEEDSEDVSKACQSRDNTNSVHIITEAAAIIDLKSETSQTREENVKEDLEDCKAETTDEISEEENTAATMSIKEVHKEYEIADSGTVKENPGMKEYPIADITNSSISDKTVKESMKEGESRPMKSTEEVSDSNIEEMDSIEETEKPENNHSPSNVKESKEEIIPIEVKEDHVHSSLIKLEEFGKDTEKETNVNEGEKNQMHNIVSVEEIGVTTEYEGISNMDVNSTDSSLTCGKNLEIPEPQNDGMQDKVPNAGREDDVELKKEIRLKEVPVDEVKEHSMVPSEEYEDTPIEERTIADETLERDQDLYEHLEKVSVDVKVVLDIDKGPQVVTEVLDELKRDEESNVPMPEGRITEAENVDLVRQSQEERSKEETLESFQQKNEPEKEKPICPLNVVSEDVNTAISGETVETSTSIEETTSIKDREERSEEEGREDSPTNHLQIEVNENTETVEAEIYNNADNIHVADSSIGQLEENEHEKQHEFSDVQPEEQVHEAIGASKEKEEDGDDVSKACQNRDSTNPEHTFPETAATTELKPETREMDNKNTMFIKEVYLLDSKNFSDTNEDLENKQEGIQEELGEHAAYATENIEEVHDGPKEECAIIDDSLKFIKGEKEEKPEVKVCGKLETDDAVEKQVPEEENEDQITLKEAHEGPAMIIMVDCAVTDDSLKSTEEDENEETPEVEVCEKLELDKTVEIAEKQILDEEDNKGETTLTAEMVKEKAKEENTAAMVSITEPRNSVIEEVDAIEETAKRRNDPNLFDIVKESKEEITPIIVKEDHVCSSLFGLEESKNDTEEEAPISCATETEETNIKGAEAEEEKNERNNAVVVEERSLETTQLEGIGVYSAEMNVKSPTEDTEIPREIDAVQDKVPNAGSEDRLEMKAEEIPSKEISAETSEKYRDLYEHSEILLSQETDEKIMQNEDNPKSDVPKAEPQDTGNESRHEVKEQLAEESKAEVTNVSTGELRSEQDNQTDASNAKTLQDEKSLDLRLKTEQNEDGKPLDEVTDLGETVGSCNDDEKVIKEENLAKNSEETESLKEDSEIGKEDQIPRVIIMNDNEKVEDYNSVSNECLNEEDNSR
ncbi:STE20-like serine/threonine-protein kinase [Hibiscus syriacus]|uniref:STE20-like serine/threonine-protein kinase n=1 Tax=Hibiscus syriacus TaxID=106335 RepID=UPI001921B46C|nr:STE20-like serine/threonine-protein kinase [Hibiscus syriacus]